MTAYIRSAATPMRIASVIAVMWLAFSLGAWLFYTKTAAGSEDFRAYYDAGKGIAAGLNPYRLREEGLARRPYLYPPLTALVLSPLAASASPETAEAVWFVGNFVLLVFTIALVSRYIDDPRLRMLWWVAPVVFTPTLQSLVHGQVTVMMFALIAGAWVALQEKKSPLAGALLAVAAWIKIYPAVVILYFIWKREWRVAAGALAAGLVLGFIQVVGVGWPVFQYFLTNGLFGLALEGQQHLAYLNNSVLGFSNRLFVASQFVQPIVENNTLYTLLRLTLSGLIIGVTVLACSLPMAYERTPARKRDLEYGLVNVAILLIASTLWESGMLPLLLVYLFLVRSALEKLDYRRLALCALSFVLIDSHRVIWALAHEQTLPALLLSMPFFGAILLWALTAAQIISIRADVNDVKS